MHYEFMVVPFGLTSARMIFMNIKNNMFSKYLDWFVHVFPDDILVYSRSEEELKIHLRKVLQVLIEHKLYVKMAKCEFFQKKI